MTERGVMAPANEKFGDLLRRLRIESDLTQEALAERAGLSVRAISDLERGVKRGPRPDTMRMLADGLGLSGEARSAFAAAARRDAIPPGPRRRPSPETAPGPTPVPLPAVPLDAMIGREAELAEVTRFLEGGARLVTLTGPGGVGKTRLALAVLDRVRGEFPGSLMVELAPVREAALLARAVAAAVGLRDDGGADPEAALVEHLRARRCLLVLDNCEQILVPVAALAGRLLAVCPELRLLVTSRVRLGLRGEREVVLAPLPVPRQETRDESRENEDTGLVSCLLSFDSVRLFVERAREADPGFSLSAQNAGAVAEIVSRLDGLPLAIELAAARAKVLPPAALLARLHRRLPLLTGGPRDVPERQQTLRNAIAWSYDLLNDEPRALFRRLSVFNGGFTLDAAEAVAGRGVANQAGEEDDVTFDLALLTGIEALADSSLLGREERGDGEAEPRFRMLETIREFGLERLAAEGEEAETRRRHAAWCLAQATIAEEALAGPAQAQWLDRLADDLDNIRAALGWLVDEAPDDALRLAAALWRFWWVRGHLSEGRAWLDRALAKEGTAPGARARAHRCAATLASAQGDLGAAADHAATALELARAAGDRLETARALIEIGRVAGLRGEPDRARISYEESLSILREVGVRAGVPDVLSELGTLAYLSGDFEGAAARYEESLTLCRELGDAQAVVVALGNLGDALRRAGQLDRAEELFAEALVRARAIGDRQGIAAALAGLGEAARARGDERRAMDRFAEALALEREADDAFGVARCLEGLAGCRAALGEPEFAARLLSAAEALREAGGAPLPGPLRAEVDRLVDALRAALDPDAFRIAWTTGRVLPWTEVVAEAAP